MATPLDPQPTPAQHDDDLDAAAHRLIVEMALIRRRKAPRIAPALVDAEHAMTATRMGAVATWRTAPGPAVLLVHGWEDDNSLWQPLLGALTEAMIPAVAIDLPGHGYSEGDRLDLITGGGALADVIAGCGPIRAIVTHSFGGPLLVEAFEHHATPRSPCVLIAPPLSQLEQYHRVCGRYGVPEPVVARAIALMDAATGRPIAQNDLRRAAPGMSAPALFVHSDDDAQCPVEASRALAALWPDGRALILDGLGHREIARDRDVAAHIVAFLHPLM